MQKMMGFKDPAQDKFKTGKSYFKAADPKNTEVNCHNCAYGEQDIDTVPCAKCHTRH